MATLILGTFAEGRVRFEIDYNDATLAVTRARCVNLEPRGSRLTFTVNGQTVTLNGRANRSDQINVPNGLAFVKEVSVNGETEIHPDFNLNMSFP